MQFTSLDFAIFLPTIFAIYWAIGSRNIRLQNLLIVFASYLFYGWWDWRFLSLIAFSTLLDYQVGLGLKKNSEKRVRKLLLWASLSINLGLLFFFKYFNFFIDSFVEAFTIFGHSIESSSLNILLPAGISFYTFQTLSYSIDLYKRKLEPTTDFLAFSAFVSFFPQLVAGPIERASHLLPQFLTPRKFNYAQSVDGLRQILWGLFKKVVIADNCAIYANDFFNNYTEYTGATLAIGAVFFALQIYGDFSGYSDIAIGSAKLFGFNLMQNFAYPYFSRSIAEFWRRWHISLSTWFRDYVYIPLGGSKVSSLIKIRNVFAIFIISGFWHGANWTFIMWGIIHSLLYLPLLLSKKNRTHLEPIANISIKELLQIGVTFSTTTIAWIFFRSSSISDAIDYTKSMLLGIMQKKGYIQAINFVYYKLDFVVSVLIVFFIIIEWMGRRQSYPIQKLQLYQYKYPKWIFYYTLAMLIILYSGNPQEFIYFQF